MIVRMQKITIFCRESDREQTVLDLQNLGLLHLEPVRPYIGHRLEEMRAHARDAQRAAEILDQYASDAASGETADRRTGADLIKEVHQRIGQMGKLEEEQASWRREEHRIKPFGDFEPGTIRRLADHGIRVKLYRIGPHKEIPSLPDTSIHVLHRDRHGIYVAAIGRGAMDIEEAEEISPPQRSLREIREEIKSCRKALEDNERALRDLASAYRREVAEYARLAEDEVQFMEARAGMGEEKPVAWLQGFCPERDVETVRRAAQTHGWGILVEAPASDDPVPTKIENPRWIRPIRIMMDFIGVVPGYREVDISMLFLLFFSLFCAIIVGDAGYGLLFLGLTFWAHRRFTQWPRPLFHLLFLTSSCTIIWGVLSGNYFGIARLPAPLAAIRIDALNDNDTVILLCFLIGAVHLTLAHLWNVIRFINTPRFLAQLGWIGTTWTMFFTARFMVLDQPFPTVMLPVFVISVLSIALFMTPFRRIKSEWFNHVVLPLNLVSNFVDVVSYVRLFAVGTATFAVANAFNQMALELGAVHWIAGLFAGLIIFFGHTLNILLATMGVLVHGIRLNTLEFAGHLGLQWTGAPYTPFRRLSESEIRFDEVMENENT